MIDLHIHSCYSDGTFSPSELIQQAENSGITAISLTDHDTIDGIEEFLLKGNKSSIECIPGIELSANYSSTEMHILGYFINHKDHFLLHSLEEIKRSREKRNEIIVSKLQSIGVNITLDDVIKIAGNKELIGRLHFAIVLINKGYASDRRDAFEKFLAKGKPAYYERLKLSPVEAIKLIKSAGGIAVLAHPFITEPEIKNIPKLLSELISFGLSGIEVFYPDHTPQQIEDLQNIASKYRLLITGGTDFHGVNIPEIKMGTGYGNIYIPDHILEKLKLEKAVN